MFDYRMVKPTFFDLWRIPWFTSIKFKINHRDETWLRPWQNRWSNPLVACFIGACLGSHMIGWGRKRSMHGRISIRSIRYTYMQKVHRDYHSYNFLHTYICYIHYKCDIVYIYIYTRIVKTSQVAQVANPGMTKSNKPGQGLGWYPTTSICMHIYIYYKVCI